MLAESSGVLEKYIQEHWVMERCGGGHSPTVHWEATSERSRWRTEMGLNLSVATGIFWAHLKVKSVSFPPGETLLSECFWKIEFQSLRAWPFHSLRQWTRWLLFMTNLDSTCHIYVSENITYVRVGLIAPLVLPVASALCPWSLRGYTCLHTPGFCQCITLLIIW